VVRVGILGTANITRLFLGEPYSQLRIEAIASRDAARAQRFAAEHGIPRWFSSYEALLADPAIDAVYIPLPQHLHAEYTIRAAQSGKHVLVEKPAALSLAELEGMESACRASGVLFMEALMYRFKTLHRRVKAMVERGEIGRLDYVDFNWSFNIKKFRGDGFRMRREAGGGALYDLGIYGVDFLWYITGTTPAVEAAFLWREEPGGIDTLAHVVCTMERTLGTITCGYAADANYYVLSGDRGSITVPKSVSGSPVENLLQVHLMEGDKASVERIPPQNPYRLELEYFADCVERGEEPEPGFTNARRNLSVLETIFRRAREVSAP
jgi:xylose dehydrogenase (NAD/NADP)